MSTAAVATHRWAKTRWSTSRRSTNRGVASTRGSCLRLGGSAVKHESVQRLNELTVHDLVFTCSATTRDVRETIFAIHQSQACGLVTVAKSTQEVGRLTIGTLGILQHAEQETCFAQQAILAWTVLQDVRLGRLTERRQVMQRLQIRVGIGVLNMGLETTVLGLVVKVKVKVFDTETRVLDGFEAVVRGHIAFGKHGFGGLDVLLSFFLFGCVAVIRVVFLRVFFGPRSIVGGPTLTTIRLFRRAAFRCC